MNISEKTRSKAKHIESELRDRFDEIDDISRINTEKVLDSFKKNRISASMFAATTGYAYSDFGRDAADRVIADIFGAEAGFVRPSIVSGTHALTIGLFGLLRPGDIMLCVTGTPYDTIHKVIGIETNEPGSLRDFGIEYRQVELTGDNKIDIDSAIHEIDRAGSRLRMIYFQRSRGYSKRPAFSVKEIGNAIDSFRSHALRKTYMAVDNCYGEFMDVTEPSSSGADIMIGSLIKNPGGGMTDTGGYIVGTEKAVSLAATRLICPGIGADEGASLGQTRNILKGLFYAPHTVAQAVKSACFASAMFSDMGYSVDPMPFDNRNDIVQCIDLGTPEKMEAFSAGIQSASPIDAFVTPVASEMAGYDDKVVMAAGSFVEGSTIELSCDGPIRPPYTIYIQGGLTYESARLAIMSAADKMADLK